MDEYVVTPHPMQHSHKAMHGLARSTESMASAPLGRDAWELLRMHRAMLSKHVGQEAYMHAPPNSHELACHPQPGLCIAEVGTRVNELVTTSTRVRLDSYRVSIVVGDAAASRHMIMQRVCVMHDVSMHASSCLVGPKRHGIPCPGNPYSVLRTHSVGLNTPE